MFNDDVTAKCPDCGSTDIAFDNRKIGCRACQFEEHFQFDLKSDDAEDNSALRSINKAHAMAVYQRWGFAG